MKIVLEIVLLPPDLAPGTTKLWTPSHLLWSFLTVILNHKIKSIPNVLVLLLKVAYLRHAFTFIDLWELFVLLELRELWQQKGHLQRLFEN